VCHLSGPPVENKKYFPDLTGQEGKVFFFPSFLLGGLSFNVEWWHVLPCFNSGGVFMIYVCVSDSGCWAAGILWCKRQDCPVCGDDLKPVALAPVLSIGDFLHMEEYSNGEDEKAFDDPGVREKD